MAVLSRADLIYCQKLGNQQGENWDGQDKPSLIGVVQAIEDKLVADWPDFITTANGVTSAAGKPDLTAGQLKLIFDAYCRLRWRQRTGS